MQIGLVVWLCTNDTDSLSEAGAGFERLHCSAMHLGLDVRALTHGWFYMFKTEKLKAGFENRILILLYFPYL